MQIQIEHIQKKYRRKEVLKDISLQASSGQCIGILGSNGAGKSTLLTILAGVLACDSGSFCCDGNDLLKNSRLRSQLVGYVPQGTPLMSELNAWDNLSLWYEKSALKKELECGVLNMLGIGEFLKTPVCKMSGGMKKRLAIGCAMASEPEILLLDEPTAALDLVCKENILEYFDAFRKRGGILIISTHDEQEIAMCDKCYILREGRLEEYNYDGDIHRLADAL